MSSYFSEVPEIVELREVEFQKVETEKFNQDYDLQDILSWGVFDYNRFGS